MEAKEQHGGRGATWRPRSNMEPRSNTWTPKKQQWSNKEAKEQHGSQAVPCDPSWRTCPPGTTQRDLEVKQQHGAEEQRGRRGATWRPRINLEAKEQHGSQEVTWRRASTWRPSSPVWSQLEDSSSWDHTALIEPRYALSLCSLESPCGPSWRTRPPGTVRHKWCLDTP